MARAGQFMDKVVGKFSLGSRLRQRSGYTAIELMVVVALIAIATAMALPHFSALVDRWRVQQGITDLQNVIRFANAQAIRTRSRVVIQAKPATCRSLQDAGNWSCGLTVFQDINQNNTQDAGEPTLREVQEFHALTVMHSGASNVRLAYGPFGVPVANPGRFEVYPAASPDSPAAQTICLSFGGRIRVKAGLGC
jgi:type IV fimbrial biogenesis protein FimT